MATDTNLRSPRTSLGAFQLKHVGSALMTGLECVTESLSDKHVISLSVCLVDSLEMCQQATFRPQLSPVEGCLGRDLP